MGSFKDNREALVLAFDYNFIAEDEFVLLYQANISKNFKNLFEENEPKTTEDAFCDFNEKTSD